MANLMSVSAVRRRLSVDGFHKMGEAGIFHEDDRVELIEGDLFEMPPIGSNHAGTVMLLDRLLQQAVGDSAIVSVQSPLRLSDDSERLPDLMLLRPREDFYTTAIPAPADVLLLIELAVSSVEYDRNTKLPLYAQHCVPEVWLIDVLQRQLEASSEPLDQGYTNFETHCAGLLAPRLLPDLKIQITRILARPA